MKRDFPGIIHESVRFVGPPGRLNGDLLHYTVRTFEEHKPKSRSIRSWRLNNCTGKESGFWRTAMLLATPWRWFYTFILRGGFLDGYRGALIAKMAARSVRLKYAKLGKLISCKKTRAGAAGRDS